MNRRSRSSITTIFDGYYLLKADRASQNISTLMQYPSQKVVEMNPKICYIESVCETCAKNVTAKTFEYFTVVLTDVNGELTYCFCFHNTKTHIFSCLLTAYSWFDAFETVLDLINQYQQDHIKIIKLLDKLYRTKVTNPNQLISLSVTERILVPNLEQLPVANYGKNLDKVKSTQYGSMCYLFIAMLNERKILLVSDDTETLTAYIFSVANLIYPLSWDHTIIPIIASSIFEVLQLPTPFLIGIHKRQFKDAIDLIDQEDTVTYDIDNDQIFYPTKLLEDDRALLGNSFFKIISSKISTFEKVQFQVISLSVFVPLMIKLIGNYVISIKKVKDTNTMAIDNGVFSHPNNKKLGHIQARLFDLPILQNFLHSKLRQFSNRKFQTLDVFEIKSLKYLAKVAENDSFIQKNINEFYQTFNLKEQVDSYQEGAVFINSSMVPYDEFLRKNSVSVCTTAPTARGTSSSISVIKNVEDHTFKAILPKDGSDKVLKPHFENSIIDNTITLLSGKNFSYEAVKPPKHKDQLLNIKKNICDTFKTSYHNLKSSTQRLTHTSVSSKPKFKSDKSQLEIISCEVLSSGEPPLGRERPQLPILPKPCFKTKSSVSADCVFNQNANPAVDHDIMEVYKKHQKELAEKLNFVIFSKRSSQEPIPLYSNSHVSSGTSSVFSPRSSASVMSDSLNNRPNKTINNNPNPNTVRNLATKFHSNSGSLDGDLPKPSPTPVFQHGPSSVQQNQNFGRDKYSKSFSGLLPQKMLHPVSLQQTFDSANSSKAPQPLQRIPPNIRKLDKTSLDEMRRTRPKNL